MSIFSILLAAVMGFCSCGGSDDDPVTSGGTDKDLPALTFTAEGGSQTVSTKAAKEWRAFASNGEPWISVSPETGAAGNVEVKITVPANNDYVSRNGEVTIKSGTDRQYVKISQEAREREKVDFSCPVEGYELVWHDEFDGESLNTADWTYEVKNSGWVNNELQNYVAGKTPNGKEVVSVKDGILNITALKENGKVYSGRIYAKKSKGWKYAYIEASINLPKGKGTWPAFWMMPVKFTSWPHDGEIDIMEEVGANPNYVSSSLHADGHVHSNGTQWTHEMYCKGAEGEFHKYAIEWEENRIRTYVDGKLQIDYTDPGNGVRDWPYVEPFYVILNLAWGGDWGGYKGIDESALPCTMQVDYVRVWQK